MGFRQDALIFLPLCICVLIFPVFLKKDIALWKSLAPLFLYLSVFFVLASPMLQRMEGAAQPQHVLIQGFARDRMDQLGIKEASYQSLLSGSDFYIFAFLSDFASRTPDLTVPQIYNDEDAVAAGQRWLEEAVFLYPADLATRGWMAIWRILRYADAFPPFFAEPAGLYRFFNQLHRSFSYFMHGAGLPLGILALVLVALKSPGTALIIFLCSSYILGYTALQTASRHTFHLSFFPFLITAFLVESAIKQIWKRKQTHSTVHPKKQYKAALGVLLLCIALIVLPVPLLRWYQIRQIRPVINSCIQAHRTPLLFSEKDHCGWTFFTLKTAKRSNARTELTALYSLLAACFNSEINLFHTRTKYLMAEFDGSSEITCLLHNYDSPILNFNFSQVLRIPKAEGTGQVLRYFFPVYEVLGPELEERFLFKRTRFTSIAVPKEFASHFRGLYEIHLPQEHRHLIAFTSVDEAIPRSLFYTPDLLPDPVCYHHVENDKLTNTVFSEGAHRFGSDEQTILFSEAQLILSDEPTDQMVAAQRLINLNRLDESLDGLLQIKITDPSEKEKLLAILDLVARISLYDNATGRCLTALTALETLAPEQRITTSLLKIEACERVGWKEEAVEIYGDYLREFPDDKATATRGHILLSDGFSLDEKYAFWLSLTDHSPDQGHFQLYRAMALDLKNKESLAKEAYAKAFALDPQDPKIMISHTIAQAEDDSVEQIGQNTKEFAANHPEHRPLICERLEREAFYLSEKGLHQKAGALLLLAAEYSPDSERLSLKASQQFTGAGDYERAEKGLVKLLDSSYAEEAAQALYVTVTLSREFSDRRDFWLGLQEAHPDNSTITSLLYTMYDDRARELLRTADLKTLASLSLPENTVKEKTPFFFLYQTMARYLEAQEDLESIQKYFSGIEEEKEMIAADLRALASSLGLQGVNELSERLTAVMTFLNFTP
jgi:hypothetical protein